MSPQLSDADAGAWRDLSERYHAYISAGWELRKTLRKFLAGDFDRLAILRAALAEGDLDAAFYVICYLEQADLMELFPSLVEWAMIYDTFAPVIQETIQSLPRDWVLARIEAAAEPFLEVDDDTYQYSYPLLLSLYDSLDHGLARKLAERAAAHPSEHIRRMGENYLRELKGSQS